MAMNPAITIDPIQAVLLISLSVVLLVWSLWDLSRPDRQVAGKGKWVWLVIILVVGLPGQLAYLLLGRRRRARMESV